MGNPIFGFALALGVIAIGHQVFRFVRINLSKLNDFAYLNRRYEY
jgi:hypothetical protein